MHATLVRLLMARLSLTLTSLCLLLLSISNLTQACHYCCPACPYPPGSPKYPPKVKPPPFHHPPWTPPVAPPCVPPPVVEPPVAQPPKPPKHHPPKGHVPSPPPPPTPYPPTPTPRPPTPGPPTPPAAQTCPIDALKLNACVDLLGGLIHIGISQEAKAKCCPLLQGIADLDAALCLCTTIRAKLLNINLVLPIALELLIGCGNHPPPGFQCPPQY